MWIVGVENGEWSDPPIRLDLKGGKILRRRAQSEGQRDAN